MDGSVAPATATVGTGSNYTAGAAATYASSATSFKLTTLGDGTIMNNGGHGTT